MKTNLDIIRIILTKVCLLSLLFVSITGCGEDEPIRELTPVKKLTPKEKLTGNYSLLKVQMDATTMEPPDVFGNLDLNSEGSWTMQIAWDPKFGEGKLSSSGPIWTADNKELTLASSIEKIDEAVPIPYTLRENTLVLILDALEEEISRLSWSKQR